MKNELELALAGGINRIDFYLGDTSPQQFIADIEDLKKKWADKAAIKQAIIELQKLL